MRAIVCQSDAEDTVAVAAELIASATEQLAGEQPKAALLFASTEYDHATLLAALRDRWPGLPLVGGTSDGEVASAGGFRHDSAVLTLLVGDGFAVHAGVGRDLSRGIDAAVAQAAAGLAGPGRICFTVFAPSTNSSEVVRQLQRRLGGERCPVVGGLSGDHGEYGKMVEFFGGEVLRDSLPVLVLTGEIGVGFGIGTGWFPIGEPHPVTAGDGHIVHAIGGEPAIEVYRNFWGTVPDTNGSASTRWPSTPRASTGRSSCAPCSGPTAPRVRSSARARCRRARPSASPRSCPRASSPAASPPRVPRCATTTGAARGWR